MSSLQLPPSRRGLANLKPDLMTDLSREIERLPSYDEKLCPEGLIDITRAGNDLMMKDVGNYIKAKVPIDYKNILSYAANAGSDELLAAISSFINRYFHPSEPIQASQVMVTNGVSALLDMLPFAVCDSGEGIMYTTPNYGMFKHDIETRNGIEIVEVLCEEQFDQFSANNADELVLKFESALKVASQRGIRVRAILLCNPSNPLGRCYSAVTVTRLARFCAQNQLHLISDEIYAMSTFPSNGLDDFTSVLSIDTDTVVDNRNIHALYGVSKDFGFGGLRLGFLITRNDVLKEACLQLATSIEITLFSDYLFTKLLSDKSFIDDFFKKYRRRLRDRYIWTTSFLEKHGIPFEPANAGLFIWINLSEWLHDLENSKGITESAGVRLTRWLIAQGVYLQPGEAFYAPNNGRFRLVYTSNPKVFEVGINRLIDLLERYKQLRGKDSLECSSCKEWDFLDTRKSGSKGRLARFICFG